LPPHAVTRLSPIDLALVAAYLVAITLFGLRFARRGKQSGSLKSYFLADNTIPWWAIALSIVSAETSTLTIVSIPGVAFAGDMGFLQVVLGYMLGRIVVALLFLPKYFRGEMLTAYQLIDRRFGAVLHKVTAGLFLLTRAAAEGVRVFAISIVVSIAIGTGDTLSIAIISALTLLYTFEGGMAAVIWTDVVQMALYVAGTLVALWAIGHGTPGGWAQIHAVAAPLGKFHMLNFAFNLTQSYTFWAGILGGTFLTMASHGTDQLMVQRMLAARNLRESRLALLASGGVIFLQFTLFLLIGVGLFVFYGAHPPHFRTNDYIFPTFIVQQMPHGVAGLLVAAILAAAMSNLSAALNSLASTTVIDFYIPLRQRLRAPFIAPLSSAMSGSGNDAEDRTRNLVSRASTVFWAFVLFGIAVYSIQAGGKGHVVETGLSIASVAYGCLLGVFLLGTLTRYATQTGAILGMICGFALNLWLWQGTFPKQIGAMMIPHIAFTWYVLIGSVATFAVGSVCSLARPRRAMAAVLLLAVTASAQAPVPEALKPGDADFSAISTLVNAAIEKKQLPGAVVVVGHAGKVVFEKAYGNRALEPKVEPMTEDTIFDMASLTKVLVTTTAILQLYEQHKLDLDAPVARYLPEFASAALPDATLPVPVAPESGTIRSTDPVGIIPSQHRAPEVPRSIPGALAWKSKITVRELLTHYSGLPEDVNLKDDWGLKAPDKAEGIRRAMAAVPYGPPGVTFKYSDIDFITLGALVEEITGIRLSDYADGHIFAPLQMKWSLFPEVYCSCSAPRPPAYGHADADYSEFLKRPNRPCDKNICLPFLLQLPTLVDRIAPTAHDDQGTAATNPDFDHLLRGIVHDPTTRRMGGVAGHAGVFSNAHDVSLFCQALLDKLLRNTGPFPLSQATLRMATIPNEPATAVHTATIFTQDGKTTTGVASRGLGWDLNSAFSRPRGEIFPISTREHPGSFGHTGFTGTSIWIDPVSDSYVILLANAIHPRGAPSISTLRGQVATAAARALGVPSGAKAQDAGSDLRRDLKSRPSKTENLPQGLKPGLLQVGYPTAGAVGLTGQGAPTQSGIDVLESTQFAALKTIAQRHGGHLRLAVLANQASIDAQRRRTIDILKNADPSLSLEEIFTPEHGLFAAQDTDHLKAETDPTTNLPVHSLYGPKASDKHPRQSDLKEVDAVVLDLQDAGVRFWTYETVMGYFLEDCARAKVEVVVLDRPNPVGGVAVQGPSSDLGVESYIDFMSIPVRHGMTLGELAKFFNDNATEVQYDPKLLDGRTVVMGAGAGDDASGASDHPPGTRPGLHAMLTVVPMEHWSRTEYFAETGLPWTPPSPNMKTPATSIVYPGVALIETTNMSVGRGSPAPYENFGAPFINATELAAYLTARQIPGVTFTAATLAIADDANRYPFHGQTIPAIHLTVTDRAALDTPEMGVEILSALHHLYPAQFQLEKAKTILLNAATLEAIKAGKDPREIAADWGSSLREFRARRERYLLYR
jgi:SSS family transporter